MKDTRPAVNIISMGCSKNLIDSERLMHMFDEAGYKVCHNPAKLRKGVAIVNTCGFIGDAKEESINVILKCVEARKRGTLSRLFVMGCLSQRYAKELPSELPEVDGWYGKFDWVDILKDLGHAEIEPSWMRTPSTPPHYAYLKIAEGCNRFCAFCAIPLITGRYKSRPVDEVLDEVRHLAAHGTKEFNVIAQDLSFYGHDLCGESKLAELIDRMAMVPGVEWIRLHYAYPSDFPYDILPVMAKHKNVCNYLDIALQHISDSQLERMHRHISAADTRALLARIRKEVPGICLRTTLMVGFPGETDEDFRQLLDFVKEQRFERMGAFAYCEEEGTSAAKLYADDVPADVKERRLSEIMELQQEISQENNERMVGRVLRVVVDSFDKAENVYRCRTEFDSPEVDQEVMVFETPDSPLRLSAGDFCDVRVTEALPFDLIGEVVR